VRAYPIRLAKLRVMPAQRVGSPRHLVVYRVAPDGITEILGLVHDRMVLSRAARRLARGNDMS
jgi:toxin ParE1/3/4